MIGWIVFIILFIIYALLSADKLFKKNAKWFLLIFFIIFSGLRYQIGWDYDVYTKLFFRTDELADIEPSWRLLILFFNYTTGNAQTLFFLSSIIIYSLIIFFIYRYSSSPVLSMLVFICFPLYYGESLSCIRQYIAVGFFLLSYKYLIKRDFLKFLLINAIGISFHYSAIVVIPFYFISHLRIPNRILIFLVVGSFFLYTLIIYFFPEFELIQKYTIYTGEGFEVESSSGIDVIMRYLLIIALLLSKKKLDYDNDIRVRTTFNFYIIGALICSGLYFYPPFRRMSYFFMIFEVLIIADLYRVYFRENPLRIKAVILYLYICFAILSFGKKWWPKETNTSPTNTYYRMTLSVDKPLLNENY
jgi:transmembrane protein EpsG